MKRNLISEIQQKIKSDLVSHDLLKDLMPEKSSDAKKSLLKRLCQKGELVHLKSGLYMIPQEQQKFEVSPFTAANYMVRPSYVSLESALSFYNLIPEAVYTTTSVTTLRNKNIDSPLGIFSFSHLKVEHFNFGFYQHLEGSSSFLLATPLKALVDYINLKNKNYQNISQMSEDLRLDWNDFVRFKEFVNKEKVLELKNIFKSNRINKILTDIERNL
jgi:hypothetical protein